MKITHVAAFVTLFALGCNTASDGPRASWNQLIKRCADTDLNSSQVLFFGPTNKTGPGSIWTRGKSGKETWQLMYDVTALPEPRKFNADYAFASCSGSNSKAVSVTVGADVVASTVGGELKNELKKSTSVQSTADVVAWVPVQQGLYEEYVTANSGASFAKRMQRNDCFVMTRAFLVRGFTSELTFSKSDAASLRAKLPTGPLPPALVSAGGTAAVEWKDDTTLKVRTEGDFYIAGEMRSYRGADFEEGRAPIGDPVQISPTAVVNTNAGS